MEALEFLKSAKRRYINNEKFFPDNISLMGTDFESYVKYVEEWAKEHPTKTRQTEFLKMFPNIGMSIYGTVDVAPCNLDKEVYDKCTKANIKCSDCYKEFWSKEVE